ncbi:MAG: site-2 protease family protein [Chloroflexi bacterium]|nr:site-2 protease family protein [Chloroflexota bacterium]
MTVIFQSVLPFLAMIVVLIVIHELGHFITAKLAGVKVLEAGIGYPPRIWGFKRGETEYTINAIPLGGFVRMLGEEDPDDPRSLAAKPRWIRLVVLGSGAAMNVVLAILLFALAVSIPRNVDESRARIAEVVPGSPAEEAGLQVGDVIFEVDGHDVQNIGELSYRIRLNLGETVDIRVLRGGGEEADFVTVPVFSRWATDTYVDEDGFERPQGPTGITISPAFGSIQALTLEEQEEFRLAILEDLGLSPTDELPPEEVVPTTRLVPFSGTQWEPPWEAIPSGIARSYESIILARNEIESRIRGGTSGGGGGFQVTGPVGIAQLTGEVVDVAGWQSLIEFAALISMNLAVLNILPLPMLDGGRIVFVLIEIVRRGKRIAPEKEAMVHFAGLVAMLLFAVVITYFDLIRIFSGDGIIR